MLNKPSLTRTSFLASVFVLLALVLSIGFYWIDHEYKRLEAATQSFRAGYMQYQKTFIRNEVDRVIDYVRFQQSTTEIRVRREIKERVDEAYAIADHNYTLYQGKMPENELKHLIIETLRPMRYDHGRGYYFAVTLSGVVELFADHPEREQKKLLGMKDARGKPVIRDMIAISRAQGEGFYEYTWTKPGQIGGGFPKVAFIKYFKPFDMFIGTGAYLDDVEKDIQVETLARIRRITFGNDGYIFVQDLEGTFLTHPQRELIGKNIADFPEPKYREIFRKIMQASRLTDGGYLTYVWRKPSTGREAPKLSYARTFSEWGWVIVTGVYLDDVEQAIQARMAEDRRAIGHQIAFIGALFLSFLALSLLLMWIFSRKIKRGVETFTDFFHRTADTYEKINPDLLAFSEFVTIGSYANKMVDDFKTSQEDLRESESRFRALFENAMEGIFQTTLSGRFIMINPALAHMLGYASPQEAMHEITDIPIQVYVNPEERQALLEQVVREGRISGREVLFKRHDGRQIKVILNVLLVRDNEGNPAYLEGSCMDITARWQAEEHQRRLEEQLIQVQKMESVGRLAGGVAHDFNNMLTPILGFAEMLKLELARDDPRQMYAEQILQSAERSRDLVRQLLAFARKQTLEMKPVNLNEVLSGFEKILRRTLRENIQIETNLAASVGMVRADVSQIEQIVLNLAVNAQDAMPDGGTLRVETTDMLINPADVVAEGGVPAGSYVMLMMRDTGSGMDQETSAHIFEPFFTTKGPGKGTGLGLATVYGIVIQHGGFVTVDSAPEKGTSIRVYLPRIEEEVASPPPMTSGKPLHGHETILLVEDEDQVRQLAGEMLRRFGYTVLEASDGSKAMEMSKTFPGDIHVLITDVILPDMNGKLVQEQLSALRPGLKVLYISGYTADVLSPHGVPDEGEHFLPKPFRLDDLARKLRRIIESS